MRVGSSPGLVRVPRQALKPDIRQRVQLFLWLLHRWQERQRAFCRADKRLVFLRPHLGESGVGCAAALVPL